MCCLRRKLAACLATVVLACTVSAALAQEESGRLPGEEARKLYSRITDLMEATSIASPELARAGAPLIENVRQSARALAVGVTREHTGVLYTLLTNARIYLQIADAVPKPQPFAEEIIKQLAALRQSVDRVSAHFRALLDYKENIVRGADRDNLRRYMEENAQLGPPAPSDNRVVFLGNSITDHWQLNQYFPGKPYINRGISGQITGQMLGRMKADVIELQPTVVVVLAGTNDLARGVPSDTIKDNLSMIGTLAAAHGITPVFASILPVSDHDAADDPNYERTTLHPPREILALNRWIEEMCQEKGFIYLDYHSAMAGADGQLKPELADDGLHPNSEGYKVMAPLTEAAIEQALQSRQKEVRKRKRLGIF